MGTHQRPSDGDRSADAISLDRQLASVATLDDLGVLARGCARCGLRADCRGVVFGEGDPHARLLLIGEGPGAREDELGRPFVGKAGALLDRILVAAGFRRSDVYISNVVMCRPPGNRTPEPAEIVACLPYLQRRIALIDPDVIVLLGATPLRALLDREGRITRQRGILRRLDGRWVLPTYHPAFLLRFPERKKEAWLDFQLVRDLCARQRPSPG